MAKEYIEREAFIKNTEARYCDPCKEIGKDSNGLKCRACWVDDMVGDIEDTSAADVAEVVHGKWDDSLDGITPYCSICGHSHKLMVRTPNYCPNCGAKMDGGEEQ
jgi:rubrerythrin